MSRLTSTAADEEVLETGIVLNLGLGPAEEVGDVDLGKIVVGSSCAARASARRGRFPASGRALQEEVDRLLDGPL